MSVDMWLLTESPGGETVRLTKRVLVRRVVRWVYESERDQRCSAERW